jgi:hypothetical protein
MNRPQGGPMTGFLLKQARNALVCVWVLTLCIWLDIRALDFAVYLLLGMTFGHATLVAGGLMISIGAAMQEDSK